MISTEISMVGLLFTIMLSIIWKQWNKTSKLEECMVTIKVSLKGISTYSKVHAAEIKKINRRLDYALNNRSP